MNKPLALGAGALAAIAGLLLLSASRRQRIGSALGRRMHRRMAQVLASLPADAPPRLVMSTLPRLREQNDRMLEMLREQNALLREQVQRR